MTASRPEAEPKYSRARAASGGRGARADGGSEAPARASVHAARLLALAAAAALLVAEPLALIRVQTAAAHRVVLTISAGSHHSYALVPLAVLAIALAWALGRPSARRAAAAALLLLGLVALGIALLGDLPEIHRSGIVGRVATGLHNARTVAGAGLYVETLGAILLLAAGVTALVPALGVRQRRRAATVRSGPRSVS
jgi:hypothetical protein